MSLQDGARLIGWFQSEKYFKDIEQTIREGLQIRKPLAARDPASCAKDIEAANSVSLHVRRGDYLRSQRHNLCSIAYYNTALDYMRGRTA
jgi:hypothetical protein